MTNHPPYPFNCQSAHLSEFEATRLREDLAESLFAVLPDPEPGEAVYATMRLSFRLADAVIAFFADRSEVSL